MLLNQLEDKNHHTRTMKFTHKEKAKVGSAWGFNAFIPHSELLYNSDRKTQYLKDDTLYFKMSIEVTDHKPWLH